MLNLSFDTQSIYNMHLPNPRKRRDIFKTGQTFVTYDQSRPLAEQLPFTPLMVDLLQQAALCAQQQREGEAQRAVASEEMKESYQRLRQLVRIMGKTLAAAFPETPTKAKGWGFRVKQSTANIILPQTPEAHLSLTEAYIAQELSRPAAERFTSPHLSDVIEVRRSVAAKVALRNAGQNQREVAIARANAIAAELYDYLQGAASYLLNFRYKNVITPELQNWGYVVVTRRSAAPTGADTPPATGSTNGTAANGPAPNGASAGALDTMADDWLNS